jgi:rod shape determining protein RodA
MAARTAIQPPESAEAQPAVRSFALSFDPVLLLAVVGLAACSLLAVGAATADDVAGNPDYFVTRQAVYFAVGGVFAVVLWRIDFSRLRELKYALYGALIVSILAVMAFGNVARGSRRAIDLPFFSFQASELGKILLILSLSAFMVDATRRLADRRTTARIMLLGLVPAGLVMLQPDLGSALVYIVIALAVLFTAGAPWRHFAALGALGLASIALALVVLPAAGVDVLHDYQKERLTAFLHPSDTAGDEGYQQNQSRIAIGSGEKTGRGDRATQTQLDFLPEHHTDFVFAVVGERWGFAGAALVLSLYALLIWRGLRILTMSKNLYGALIAGGIVAMLLFQVFVNVGMNVGIMPITGIPLPLMSYGGSSILTTMLAIGLLQSIHAQGRSAAASKGRVLTFQ